jgi:hypothetical protein
MIGTTVFILGLTRGFQLPVKTSFLLMLTLPCGTLVSTASSLLFLESEMRRHAIMAALFHLGCFLALVLLVLLVAFEGAGGHYRSGAIF